PTRSFSIGDLDTALTWAWGLSAGAVALALLGAGLRLAAWRRRWRVTTLDGRTVLVSENVGPAVIGVWRPQVVLPGWSLELRPTAAGGTRAGRTGLVPRATDPPHGDRPATLALGRCDRSQPSGGRDDHRRLRGAATGRARPRGRCGLRREPRNDRSELEGGGG